MLRYEPDPELPMAAVHINVEPPFGDEDAELEAAVALAAAAADVAVVVVGTTQEVESEGFDRTTPWPCPPGRTSWSGAWLAANPRTVVVVNSGVPVLLPWADEGARRPAHLVPGPGVRQRAVRRAGWGCVEPGGRLPVTWPAEEEGLPSTYAGGRRAGLRRGPAHRLPRLRPRRP